MGHRLRWFVTPADEPDRARVADRAAHVQEATGASVEVAFVDQGNIGEEPAQEVADHGIRSEVVQWPEAKNGLVLLPRR